MKYTENKLKVSCIFKRFDEQFSNIGFCQKLLSLPDIIFYTFRFYIGLIPILYWLKFIPGVVLGDKLKKYFKEEDLKVGWDFRWRVGVDFHEDTNVFLE